MARNLAHVACSVVFVLLASDALEDWWCNTSDCHDLRPGISMFRLAAAQPPSKTGPLNPKKSARGGKLIGKTVVPGKVAKVQPIPKANSILNPAGIASANAPAVGGKVISKTTVPGKVTKVTPIPKAKSTLRPAVPGKVADSAMIPKAKSTLRPAVAASPEAAIISPEAAIISPEAAIISPEADIVSPEAAIISPDEAPVRGKVIGKAKSLGKVAKIPPVPPAESMLTTTGVRSPNAPATRDDFIGTVGFGKFPPIPKAASVLPPDLPESTPQTDSVANSFIRVSGNVFVDDSCHEYLYTGWNGYNELLKAGLKVPAPKSLAAAPGLLAAQSDFATDTFAEAKAAKLRVTRVFAAGGDRQDIQLQVKPGVYNETVFRGIDYVLAQAARYQIKVVLSIINNWDKIDGKGQYVAWARVTPDEFWTNSRVRAIYKAHLRVLTNRVNVFTGVAYKNDPAIFSWNLYNEPRNPDSQKGPGKTPPVTAWVNEMSAVLAALDTNHMITVGEEGFFTTGSPFTKYNPYGLPGDATPDWAGRRGQDFVAQHSSPNIAYAAFHFWPNNWNTLMPEFLPLWLDGHILAARQLKKPLVLEEFGKVAATADDGTRLADQSGVARNITLTRNPTYRQIYKYVERGLAEGGPLRSALFWEWSRTDRFSGNSVLTADSTFGIIKAHAAYLAGLPGKVQPGCSPRASGAAGATPPAKKAPSKPKRYG